MWDIRQPNGRREFNELHVPVHTDIRLLLTSEDVIHQFLRPGFPPQTGRGARQAGQPLFNATRRARFLLLQRILRLNMPT